MGCFSRLSLLGVTCLLLMPAAASANGWTDSRPAVMPYEGMLLDCDNGRSYPIHARAVSDAGELVTGYIVTGPRRSHHFRLVPMGTGYRYAGRGFWFDGVRGEAVLHVGRAKTYCTVAWAS